MLDPRESFDVDLHGGVARRTLVSWLVLHILGGHILLPILLVTFIYLHRHPVLISMCAYWILSSTTALLLFYGEHGGVYDRADLARGELLCKVQAVIMQHAVSPMNVTSALALIYHVWATVQVPLGNETRIGAQRKQRWLTPILVLAPFVAFAGFTIAGSVVVSVKADNASLERRKFYCTIGHSPLSIAVAIYCAITTLATTYFEVRVMIALRRFILEKPANKSEDGTRSFRPLLVRAVIFGIYALVALGLAFTSFFLSTVALDMFVAVGPLCVFLVFGFQANVVQAWCFCRRREVAPQPLTGNESTVELKGRGSPETATGHV